LAAEEYAVKNIDEDVVMLWQSSNSVIIGKHQNAVKEVNVPFVFKNNIPVIRRISGGGTVFHSLGNLNYSVITTHKNRNDLVNFGKFTKTIVDFLKRYGVEVIFEGKNNLRIDGKKFSGNSAHVFKNRIIHHGTILFDADLELLETVILPTGAVVSGKAPGSVRTTVTSLKRVLNNFEDVNMFRFEFEKFLFNYHAITKSRGFTAKEKSGIKKLAADKYRTPEWTWGYSPDYIFENKKVTGYGEFSVFVKVSKGIISDIRLFFEGKRLINVENRLSGKMHEPQTIFNELSGNMFVETITEVLF
jgi:lipoate-protein ligase A